MTVPTDDFIEITAQQVLGRMKEPAVAKDNLKNPNLIRLPTKPPPPLREPDIPKISASDPCIGCQEIYNERGREMEMVKRMYTTEQGQSYLTVKSAIETAAWEYAS